MPEFHVRRPLKRQPTHPGELIREILDETLHLSISAAARRIHVSRQSLHAVLGGRAAVTADMALRLGKLFGSDPDLWLAMQQAHDLWDASHRMADELATIDPVQHRAA